MSDQQDPKQNFYDLKRDEVEGYFDNASTMIVRTDRLMSDHYTGKNVLGPEILQRVAELHALPGAFQSYLEKTFNLAAAPENAMFRVKFTAATGIIKMVFAMFESKEYLSRHNISLEDQ